jgi:hypothetical protein
MKWLAEVTIYPYSTDAGAAEDRAAIGNQNKREVEVEGDTIRLALKQVDLYILGVQTNPRVWTAFCTSIKCTGKI